MDESCPSVAIQVSSDPTPAEVVIITLSERNGSFQVSLGTGECKLSVFFFFFFVFFFFLFFVFFFFF